MDIITTEDLSRHYGRRIGVDRINLRIGAGEIFGFLGPNGSGKTTTIRLLLGFLQPHAGCARIGGLDCWRQSPQVKRDVGYLPGDLRLYPWFTARKAIHFVGQVRGADLRRHGGELAERFQLEVDLRVRKMSRGMRQKLGLVLAMVHRPRLLILDEPTSGLDPLMQLALTDCLRELAAAGHTVFFSSHTLSEVESLCNRVAIVRQGRIVADERLESLRRRAPRRVRILFASTETALRTQLPSFLKLMRRDRRLCHCELEGTSGPLIRWAAGQALDDLSISEPDLQSLFQKYYVTPDV